MKYVIQRIDGDLDDPTAAVTVMTVMAASAYLAGVCLIDLMAEMDWPEDLYVLTEVIGRLPINTVFLYIPGCFEEEQLREQLYNLEGAC